MFYFEHLVYGETSSPKARQLEIHSFKFKRMQRIQKYPRNNDNNVE